MTISEENARLNKELNLLRYKTTEMQEELERLEVQLKEEIALKIRYGEKLRKLKDEYDLLSFVSSSTPIL